MTDDELLNAYADGELPEGERAAFEVRLQQEPALARALSRLRDADALLRDAVPPAPIDDILIARLGLASAQPSAPQSAEVVKLPLKPQAANDRGLPSRLAGRWTWVVGGALAASLALMVAVRTDNGPDGSLDRSAAFQMAMDELPSGAEAGIDGDSRVSPVLTFPQKGGGFCREFVIRGPDAARGMACQQSGKWAVQATVPLTEQPDEGTEIVTAGGGSAAELDRVFMERRGGDPLSADAERTAIAARWKEISAAPE